MASMALPVHLFCILACFCILANSFTTQPLDTAALNAFRSRIHDPFNHLQNWQGDDPCAASWTGVLCSDPVDGIRAVIQLRLLNSNLTGELAPELGQLANLKILDLMWNQITGSIPKELGNLSSLELLLLNGNNLTGWIPEELGNLTRMNRFQIDLNNLSGPVPISFKNLANIRHLHMNNNSLTGSIPPELGSLSTLLHLCLDNNNLTGALPKELANATSLELIQLDNNQFSDAVIPAEYGRIANLTKLSLRNCNLKGQVPDLKELIRLRYLDLSLNKLSGGLPSLSSTAMTTIDLSHNMLNGSIPLIYGNLPNLQYLVLNNNNLTGSIPQALGTGTIFNSSWSGSIIMDFQNNSLSSIPPSLVNSGSQKVQVWLHGNVAICNDSALANYCRDSLNMFIPEGIKEEDTVATCQPSPCVPGEEVVPYLIIKKSICICAMPIAVGYRLKSPGFSFFMSYVTEYERWIAGSIRVAQGQVYVESFLKIPGPRFSTILKIFPSEGEEPRVFNQTEVLRIYDDFSAWKLPKSTLFGPQELLFFEDPLGILNFDSGNKLSWRALAGILVACISVTAIVVASVVIRLVCNTRHSMTAERRRLLSRETLRSSHMGIKIAGVKSFTYEELAVATKRFSGSMQLGIGGYGNVYRGNLKDGQVVAIKCAKEVSCQGADQFYTEIELLSRIHHRNLVSLIGYCDDEGEQMLVYEFMANGNLRDQLAYSNPKHTLNFSTRLRIALGAARGILYLHTEANPPIFHRDIKASNILLDEKFNARVSDFGLSRLAPYPKFEGSAPGNVSTVVKGTPGYLDPEYFRTQILTNKSDVYSFGVVLLELITGMEPIAFDKNIIREVTFADKNGTLHQVVDSRMGTYPAEAIEPLVRLALCCCEAAPADRPTMAEVVRSLEKIWQMVLSSNLGRLSESLEMKDIELGSVKEPSRQDSGLSMASTDFNKEIIVQPR